MSGKPLFGPVNKKQVGPKESVFSKITCAHISGLSVIICIPKAISARKYKNEIQGLISNGLGKGLFSRGMPNYEKDHKKYKSQDGLDNVHLLLNEGLVLERSDDQEQELIESLYLYFEEAFHLLVKNSNVFRIYSHQNCYCHHSYGFDMTQVDHLNIQEVWNTFCNGINDFPLRFRVYTYFRKFDWVVKMGSKIGVDYLLYPFGGPEVSHAQYGVLVITEETHLLDFSIFIASRVLHHLAKNLILSIVKKIAEYDLDHFCEKKLDTCFQIHNLGLSRSI